MLSLKDQLSTTPLPGNLYDNVIYENIDNIDPDTGLSLLFFLRQSQLNTRQHIESPYFQC